MRRPSITAVLLALTALGCGSFGMTIGSVVFDDNPASLVGGLCASQATVTSSSDDNVILVAMTSVLTDVNGVTATVTKSAEELAAGNQAITLAAGSGIQLDLSFDLNALGLTTPVSAEIVLIGVGNSAPTEFVGTLRCEG